MDIQTTVILSILAAFGSAIAKLWTDAKQAAKDQMICEKTLAGLAGELTGLRRELDLLHSFSGKSTEHGATVIARTDGVILDVSGRVNEILGWRDVELIGQNINVFIGGSPEVKMAHHRGLENVASGGSIRRSGAISGLARRGDNGKEVPVVIDISIVNFRNQRCVKAQIFLLIQQQETS